MCIKADIKTELIGAIKLLLKSFLIIQFSYTYKTYTHKAMCVCNSRKCVRIFETKSLIYIIQLKFRNNYKVLSRAILSFSY